MQNALSGPVLLNKKLGSTKFITIGLKRDSEFVPEEFLKSFSGVADIDFNGIMVDGSAGDTGGKQKRNGDYFKGSPSNYNEAILTKLENDFAKAGISINIPSRHLLTAEYIQENSGLCDLFCVGNEFLSDSTKYINFLTSLNCPVYVFPYKAKKIDHIMYYFDGSSSGLKVIKNMISIFGEMLLEASVSVMVSQKARERGGLRETVVVDFLLSKFNDVGVLPVSVDSRQKHFARLYEEKPNALLVTGHEGISTFFNQPVKDWILKEEIPVFYSN